MKSVRHVLAAVISTAVVSASTVAVGLASPVSAASPPSIWAEFANCPFDASVGPKEPVNTCVVSTAKAGYFIVNNTILPFTGPGIVQGGFDRFAPAGANWADSTNGVSFSAPAQPFPGGVAALLGNPQLKGAVNIVGEVAGPLAFNFSCALGGNCPVLTVPLKFHLHNPNLGPNCFIGSDTSPITLGLTPGTTNPQGPGPNQPITGSLGRLSSPSPNILNADEAVFVDNTFAVPAATGCGSFGSLDSAINSAQGLPAPAAFNTVVFVGSVHFAIADAAERHLGG